jgi:hypothetical protein
MLRASLVPLWPQALCWHCSADIDKDKIAFGERNAIFGGYKGKPVTLQMGFLRSYLFKQRRS